VDAEENAPNHNDTPEGMNDAPQEKMHENTMIHHKGLSEHM